MDVQDLFAAVYRNDNVTIERLLCQNAALVNVRVEEGPKSVTALLEASRCGTLQAVRALIKHGADVNMAGRIPSLSLPRKEGGYGALNNIFPLYVAAMQGIYDIAEELIYSGADVNQATGTGETALHACSIVRDGSVADRIMWLATVKKVSLVPKLTRKLINCGANVNSLDKLGKTPLHYACQYNNSYTMLTLLEHGADPKIRDRRGFSILETAANEDNLELMETLLKHTQWSAEEMTEAYETVRCMEKLPQTLKKAHELRVANKLTKPVVKPAPCYGNIVEQQTEEDLADGTPQFLMIQVQCARERIYAGRFVYLSLLNSIGISMVHNQDSNLQQVILHHIDLFRRNNDYLHFFSEFMSQGCILKYLLHNHQVKILEANTLEEIMRLAIQSAAKMKEAISKEDNILAVYELVEQLEQTLLTVGTFLLFLEKKQDDRGALQSLIKEFCGSFNHIESDLIGYRTSLLHVMLNRKYTSVLVRGYPILPDYDLIRKLMRNGADVHYVDSDGNTVLHMAVSQFKVNIPTTSKESSFCTTFKNLLKLFLEEGVHSDARNKAGKRAQDILQQTEFLAIEGVTELLSGHQFPMLKCLAARALKSSTAFRSHQVLPASLSQFIEMH